MEAVIRETLLEHAVRIHYRRIVIGVTRSDARCIAFYPGIQLQNLSRRTLNALPRKRGLMDSSA